MADHKALKFVGILFGCITLAVTITAVLVVKGHADGQYRLEGAKSVTIAPEAR